VSFQHTPVLLDEIISFIPESAEIIIDFTLGGANHSQAILEKFGNAYLYGIDRDQDAIEASRTRLAAYKDRLELRQESFSQASNTLIAQGIKADFILADLGASSHQLLSEKRGFSFRQNGPLDMRMNSDDPFSAADIVNTFSEQEINGIIRTFGEEQFSQRIARNIITSRDKKPFTTTKELSDCILQSIPKKFQFKKTHAATKTFQALRIKVNEEIAELGILIKNSIDLLKPKGRIAIITFHSLEDRPVKQAFKRWQDPCTCPKNIPLCICNLKSQGRLITRKAVKATDREIEINNRSRSARLRVFEKS